MRTFRGLRNTFLLATVLASVANAQPTFTKVFAPDTIGPGGVSMLTFTITNGSVAPVTDLDFTDNLPLGMTIADPAIASSDCTNPVLSAPVGGGTFALSDGGVPGTSACTVMVQVTSSTTGAHVNTSGDLTSSAGNSETATDTLTVATNRPGFSKSFAPSSVPLGGRSTLTFTINNTANVSAVTNLDFTDNLPVGMVIAALANASTDCESTVPASLIAVSGTSVVTLDADGTVAFPVLGAGATCTVFVDVIGEVSGDLDNLTDELIAVVGGSPLSSGKATATLEVRVTPLLTKDFTDDPVPPGGTVTLEFTIENFDRDFSATGIAFTDDLTTTVPALAGLTFASLLFNDCGGSVTGVGMTTIGLTGGTLGPEGQCTIRVSLTVPGGLVADDYVNTTGAITGTIDGSPFTGNMATDTLFVSPIPLLTKEFTDDPVNPGDTVTLRFTITNTSTTSPATDIAFEDLLPTVLQTASMTPANGDCGAGSIITFTPLSNPLPPAMDSVIPATISVSDATLAAAPGAGSSCTFDFVLDVAADAAAGDFLNTTEEITATVDGAPRTGSPASDTLMVLAGPSLQKSFSDDPVEPGGTVTLEFTLTHSPDVMGPATGITFTDNLAMTLAGLTANLPSSPDPPCGAGSTLVGTAGDTLLTLMGGTLTDPGDSCTFSVTLDVPAGAAPGSNTNTTSLVTATVESLMVTSAAASDDLEVAGLTFTKEFLDAPVIPGDTVTLRFTIDNVHPTDDATTISFTDNLGAFGGALAGLAATDPPTTNTCGGALVGTTSLTYSGGSVMSGMSCTIEVPVLVPLVPLAADGTYVNTTSSLSATQDGGAVFIDAATDDLIVNSNLLFLTKEFTDDPIPPGGTGTLEFTLTNLDASAAASDIAFMDDLGATLSGLEWTMSLFNDCLGMAGAIGSTFDYSGGSLAAGASCTISISIIDTLTSAPGFYPNTTSGVTGMIGGLLVTGDPAVDDLAIGALGFSKSFSGMPEAGDPVTLTFTISNASGVEQPDIGFTDDLDAVLAGLAPVLPLPADPCGLGSTLTIAGAPATIALANGTVAAGGSCSVIVPLLVPAAASLNTYSNTSSDLFQGGVVVAPPATANLVVTGEITNQVMVTADGATPAVGQTTDTIQP